MKGKAIAALPMKLDGVTFVTDDGVEFTVMKGQFFPTSNKDEMHNTYLDSLRVGILVSVPYHGHPVPLIRVDQGVVKISVAKVNGQQAKGARVISTLLGVKDTKEPLGLYQA